MGRVGRTAVILATALALAGVAHAEIPNGKVKIGVLTDLSGPYEANGGHGSVEAAKMAAEDFGNKVNGKAIEIVAADHQNKPDVGASIAAQWFDQDGVDVITDLINSGVAGAVVNLAKQRGKTILLTSAGSADFTGKACAPDTLVQWVYDSYAAGNAAGEAMPYLGKTWFFVTADYVYGKGVQEGTTRAVTARGGTVLGGVLHPVGTADFSSFMLQAQSSKAEVIALANGGQDTMNAIKAANEFGILAGGQKLFPGVDLTSVRAMGLPAAQGLIFVAYWRPDISEQSMKFFKDFVKRTGNVPGDFQVGTYSVVRQYLKAVEATNSIDTKTVLAKMREMKVDDAFTDNGKLRPDGRMVHDIYLLRVKSPAESKSEFDYVTTVATLPGDKVFRPMADGGCAALTKP
ncbi:MAG: putative branched-chain amino transporter, periplasmic binding protein [Rhodospirillales bacterium]|nr:putative branched-chain amino transporter, periplasmic binding protein [Rhodospirillales bacterium]